MNIFWVKVKKFFGAPLSDLERLALHDGPVVVVRPQSSTAAPATPTSTPSPTPPVAPSPGVAALPPAASPPSSAPLGENSAGEPPHKWDGFSVVLGVDTSHYQQMMGAAEWADLFARGFRWMYPKKVDGDARPDSYFLKSKQLAKAAGFVVFAGYCFFRFDRDPTAQAAALCADGVRAGEGPFILDCEWDNASSNPAYHDGDHGGTLQMIDAAGEERLYKCLCTVERLSGVTPWLYGSYGFLRFVKPDRFARFPFIVANYSLKASDDKVPLPRPWKREVARQYSGSLKAGSTAEIDGDRFLGTLEQLKGYLKV